MPRHVADQRFPRPPFDAVAVKLVCFAVSAL
jgi:hypothetical protein